MSRGPGHIQRTIAEAFAGNPDKVFTVRALCKLVWPGYSHLWPDHKHRSAVLRAAGKVASDAGWIKFSLYHMANETSFISAGHPLAGNVKGTLSQRAIADVLGVSERTIRRDLASKTAPSIVTHSPQSQQLRMAVEKARFGITSEEFVERRLSKYLAKRTARRGASFAAPSTLRNATPDPA